MTITVAELVAEVRKPGKVTMPVVAPHNVHILTVEKGDLLKLLGQMDPTDKAPWYIIQRDSGYLHIDSDHTQ